MSSIYALTREYQELEEIVEELDIDTQILADTLESLDGEFDIKIENYAKIIKNLENEVNGLNVEIDRLQSRREVIKNNIKQMKEAVEIGMRASHRPKIKTHLFSFSIQKNPKSLDLLDISKIPAEFLMQQEAKVDKKAALDYIKEHGDQEWGKVKQTEGLRIR